MFYLQAHHVVRYVGGREAVGVHVCGEGDEREKTFWGAQEAARCYCPSQGLREGEAQGHRAPSCPLPRPLPRQTGCIVGAEASPLGRRTERMLGRGLSAGLPPSPKLPNLGVLGLCLEQRPQQSCAGVQRGRAGTMAGGSLPWEPLGILQTGRIDGNGSADLTSYCQP